MLANLALVLSKPKRIIRLAVFLLFLPGHARAQSSRDARLRAETASQDALAEHSKVCHKIHEFTLFPISHPWA